MRKLLVLSILLFSLPYVKALGINSLSDLSSNTLFVQLFILGSFLFNLIVLVYILHLKKKAEKTPLSFIAENYEYSDESLSELELFVKTSILRGVEKPKIKNDLIQAGWDEKVVDSIINKYSNWSKENSLFN